MIILACGLAGFAAYQCRSSTLIAPLLWGMAAMLVVGFVASGRESLAARQPLAPWEFALCCLTLCPTVSVMGAKRPQDLGWNFVVLALWGVVVLPAVETFLIHPDQRLFVGPARGCMLWALIALAPINYVPTRFWLSALVVPCAQVLMLGEYLPGIKHWHQQMVRDPVALGAMLILVVPFLASICSPLSWWQKEPAPLGLSQTWIRFRDAFGLLWGLRFVERVNQAADQAKLPVWLSWSGLRNRETGELVKEDNALSLEPAAASIFRTAMHGMLRRFWPPAQVGIVLRLPT